MLYTIFIDALPTEYEVETGNLAPRDTIGREEIIKVVRERYHRLSRNSKKGSNPGNPLYAGDGASSGHGKGEGGGASKKADVVESTGAAVETPTKTVVAQPRLPVTIAAAPKPPTVVPQ